MFRSKHFITAMLVAPVLAILGYFAVDFAVSEDPEVAREGGQYKLAAASNCRYESGQCTLSNGNFELEVEVGPGPSGEPMLHLESAFPLEGVQAAWLEDPTQERKPTALLNQDEANRLWSMPLAESPASDGELRLVAKARGSLYYAQTGTRFIEYQTSFGEDFR